MRLQLVPDPEFPLPQGVSLRVLGKDDIHLLVEHVCAMDPQGRHDRFNAAANEAFVRRYAERCIHPGALVIACEQDGHVIGVAEMHPVSHDGAELAFSVLKEHRGRGIGAALFATILEAAWSRGLDMIGITTHSGNQAMQSLARKFGATLRYEEGDTSGRIRLDEIRLFDARGDKVPRALQKRR
jgi:RimJ/RimL family protein N-acetyltransferase